MKRLILLRHAKSDWSDEGLDDHERPLNPRGQRDAPRIGRWLQDKGYLPDEVLCSTARRTRETWAGLGLDGPEPRFLPELYEAAPGTLLSAVRGAAGTCVMVIAHNPGIGALARELLAEIPGHPSFARYPTAATAVVEFDIDGWRDLRPSSGRLVAFVTPRLLDAS